ncbi:ThuA domain-containing protein [Streptomyces sp. NPDC046977]|uniref:ThuA domain-containing protein n=1 Tax=Streptomyces sp. NPDC046977 TaxID=3154703 RepID=UPI0033CA0E75
MTALTAAGRRAAGRLLLLLAVLLGVTAAPAVTGHGAAAATPFKVIAFYNGTYDAAHINFVGEANRWFPQQAAANGFTYTSTNNWNLLADSNALKQYQVVLFLDDAPQTAAQRAGFESYMRGGGGWLGFHVSAFTTSASSWPWYYNQFLGSGNFATNTWGPTTAVLRVEDRTHPSTVHLPATFTSAVSEWYSWSNDLRNNPDIDILASVDPVSFPLGTDPNQSWYSGYYPILWTNNKYRMLYANFGHNAMNYDTNTGLSSTFASATQNTFLLDGLKWLGTGSTGDPNPPTGTLPSGWATVAAKHSGKCVDAAAAATANGTAVQQYACNGTTAQDWQFQATSDGYYRVNNRNDATKSWDVTGVSTADAAKIQLWSYSNGANQQWLPVAETGGTFHFVNRNSGKCLDVPSASTADAARMQQYTCNGTAAQSFQLTARS